MFQLVLYYKKKVQLVSKTVSVEDLIKSYGSLSSEDCDKILDEFNETKKGRQEIVTTYVRIDEDENFVDTVLKVERDPNFVEWEESSKNAINKVIAKL